MSSIVLDVLYVKMIEKTILRKLDEDEIEALRFGEPIFVQDFRGTWMSFRAPLYNLPYDLMPKDTDARAIIIKDIKKTKFYNVLNEDLRNQMLFEVMDDKSKYPTKEQR
jgi:hypothetical protein